MIPANIKLLIDLTLGDGWIGYNGNSVRGRIEHSIKQKEYAQHKEQLLAQAELPFTAREYTSAQPKNLGKQYYQINLLAHPDLSTARKHIYNAGRKAIDKNILKYMDNRTLAYLFMDDGYAKPCYYLLGKYERFDYVEPKTHCYRISTNNFNYSEHLLLQDWLVAEFNIHSTLEKQYSSHRIVITAEQSKDNFRDAIKDMIIPSMYYKICNRHNFNNVAFTKVPRDNKDRKRLSEETLLMSSDATVQ